jgi:hypothetical protein
MFKCTHEQAIGEAEAEPFMITAINATSSALYGARALAMVHELPDTPETIIALAAIIVQECAHRREAAPEEEDHDA